MRKKFQQVGLVAFGAALGVAASLHFSAVADRQVSALQLPVDDLRLFSEVFGRIKSDYVEPVEDRKLLKEAINGMLTGLDPHSAFLDQDAYRDLQVGTQGEFGGVGIVISMKDGHVTVVSPMEDTPGYKAGILSGAFYFQAAALFATAFFMAAFPQYSHFIYGVVAALCFFLPGLKYYRQRRANELNSH